MAKLSDAEVTERIRGRAAVCWPCANEYGAEWPDGHQATGWVEECGFCGAETNVCSVRDWRWLQMCGEANKSKCAVKRT
jgi:hypothetical protein